MKQEPTLTLDDLSILQESLTAWERKDFGDDLMEAIMFGLIPQDNMVVKRKIENDRKTNRMERKKAMEIRLEKSILLKAKLIAMKHCLYQHPSTQQ